MRYIVFNKHDQKIISILDLPFEYKVPIKMGESLVTGHDEYHFNLTSKEYFFIDGEIKEASKEMSI